MAKTRVSITPQEYAQRWENGLNGAVSKIQSGIAAVTESPTAKAALAQGKWLAGVQRAANEGRFAAGCNAVTLEDWKRVTTAKVASNLSAGVTAARGKVATVGAQLIQHINAALPTINAMPKVSMQDSINKVAAMMQHMASFRKS